MCRKIDATGDNHNGKIKLLPEGQYRMFYPLVIPLCTET